MEVLSGNGLLVLFISTSYLEAEDYLAFPYHFIFDRIVCVLVTFYQRRHCDANHEKFGSH